jgi:hypothetical protein
MRQLQVVLDLGRAAKALACAALLLASSVAFGQSYTFSEMQWGMTRAEVTAALGRAGFPNVRPDKDNDLRFEGGTLLGHKAGGFAMFSSDRLVKVQVFLLTPDNKARETFTRLREALQEKYGAPTRAFQLFTKPYFEGDGYEEQALRLGKARFSAFWLGEASKQALWLQITEKLAVVVNYESAEWKEESVRRQKQETKLF